MKAKEVLIDEDDEKERCYLGITDTTIIDLFNLLTTINEIATKHILKIERDLKTFIKGWITNNNVDAKEKIQFQYSGKKLIKPHKYEKRMFFLKNKNWYKI